MVHESETIEPDHAAHERYRFFVEAYAEAYPVLRPLIHRVTEKVAEEERVEA
jgi:hypothetical protein